MDFDHGLRLSLDLRPALFGRRILPAVELAGEIARERRDLLAVLLLELLDGHLLLEVELRLLALLAPLALPALLVRLALLDGLVGHARDPERDQVHRLAVVVL